MSATNPTQPNNGECCSPNTSSKTIKYPKPLRPKL